MRVTLQIGILTIIVIATILFLTFEFGTRRIRVKSGAIAPLDIHDLEQPSEITTAHEDIPAPPPPSPLEKRTPPPPPPVIEPKISAENETLISERTQISDQEFYAKNASAVVQIFCQIGSQLFSASGVILNQRGLILTNAHVAEVMERVGKGVCQARNGNPAEAFADLEIVYRADTTKKISDTDVPERDVAFLRLISPKEAFSAAVISVTELPKGAQTFTLGYPSEFLEGLAAANNASLLFSSLTVADLADIDGNSENAEVYVFLGGLALQQGSSGTAVFAPDGSVAGIIFATTRSSTTADRQGIALTTAYLDRIITSDTGLGLIDFIAAH